MADIRSARPILPQPDYKDNPGKTLRLLQRLDRENNVLPLESWTGCFRRGPASKPDQIVPGLYLSNLKTAAQYLLGGPQGYRHVDEEADFNRRDTKTENILRDFDYTSSFIHEAVELYNSSCGRTGVLVHCFAGVSRSASLVMAYLLKHPEVLPPMVKTMMLDEVYDTAAFVRSRRAIVSPNIGFRKQLGFYHDVLDCSLTDDRGGQLKKRYVNWTRQRACNNSREVEDFTVQFDF